MRWLRTSSYIGAVLLVFVTSTYFTMKILLKSQKTIICPDVVGKNVQEAKKLIESTGLDFSIVRYEKRNDVPLNHITVQKPEANIPTKKGRTVMVIVSEGPELVQVPQLTGQPIDKIDDILKDKNISIEKVLSVPGNNPGKVIAQIPRGGENTLTGKGIVLFAEIPKKRYVLMPDIKTMNLNDIADELVKKGIKYKITYLKQDDSPSRSGIAPSVPSGRIFNADEGIEIKVNTGGDDE